jgi:hypothetical protein
MTVGLCNPQKSFRQTRCSENGFCYNGGPENLALGRNMLNRLRRWWQGRGFTFHDAREITLHFHGTDEEMLQQVFQLLEEDKREMVRKLRAMYES